MPDPDFSPRRATVQRSTNETDVHVELSLDGDDEYRSRTGLGFLDHMLDLFAKHGGFGLDVTCDGDLHVDDHHTAEDVGITMGQAFARALGKKSRIARYGHAYVPMDETLARAVVDLSGRFYSHIDVDFDRPTVGDLSTEMIPHFFSSFAEHLRCNLHLAVLYGSNDHHRAEALFKSTARALRMAVSRSPQHADMPSTKGTL